MGVRRVAGMAALSLLLIFWLPARVLACTPIVSVGFGAVGLAYILWLVFSLLLAFRYRFVEEDLKTWAFLVPLGFLWFAAPILILLLPAGIVFLAFPMHLAVQFFASLFHKDIQDRFTRLLYYGLPAAVVLALGIYLKMALYSRYGGLRAFLWNYFESGGGRSFLIISLAVGLVVLGKALLKAKC